MKVFIILSLAAAAVAQIAAPPQYQPIPYSYNYVAENEDGGSSSRQESGDGAGRVSGSYSVNDLEGHARIVEYVADENGFRANIRSNEPGIISAAPADVVIESAAGSSGAVAPAAARSYSAPVVAPVAAPVIRPAQPAAQPGIRYVLVPESDPRAAGGIPI